MAPGGCSMSGPQGRSLEASKPILAEVYFPQRQHRAELKPAQLQRRWDRRAATPAAELRVAQRQDKRSRREAEVRKLQTRLLSSLLLSSLLLSEQMEPLSAETSSAWRARSIEAPSRSTIPARRIAHGSLYTTRRRM